MRDNQRRTTHQPSEKSDETWPEEGTELEESDLESVAGGVTWHTDTVDVGANSWDDTPDL